MALHHRKLLPTEADKSYAPTSCYMCYVCPDDCYLQPPPPQPPPSSPKTHQISTIFILMLCVLAAVFLFLSYLTVRRFRNSRRRNSAGNGNLTEDFIDEHQAPVVDHPIWYIRTVGLPQSAIDSISVFKYKKGDGLIDGCDCSICLNEFQENESLRLLPKCSHAFHVMCIDTWLRSHKNCPVCRGPDPDHHKCKC
ncbi:UNVERIFIED_CONTAM: RING-H2 finger protein ATL54 [Sesamum latifolium]|uniref:RING-type E3 ubiquitin transferase n=1 Tax=Sesamum latifolium TaxID=2727402 RepID=A0AAW2Y6F4_9LAMI